MELLVSLVSIQIAALSDTFPTVLGEDFEEISSLSFSILGSELGINVCKTLSTVPDTRVEDAEQFTVTVQSTDAPIGLISVVPNTQIATITESSSKPILLMTCNNLFFLQVLLLNLRVKLLQSWKTNHLLRHAFHYPAQTWIVP